MSTTYLGTPSQNGMYGPWINNGDQSANVGTPYQGSDWNMQAAFNGGAGAMHLPTPYTESFNARQMYSNFDGNRMQGYTQDPRLTDAALNSYQTQDEFMKMQMKGYTDQQNSFSNQYLKPGSQMMAMAGGLANMYLGFQNLKTQKEYLGIAKEQWGATKDEMARIQGVRANITAAYNK